MHSLDATHASPLGLLRELLAGLTAEGQVLVGHGDDISERRLRAAMASLSRGLGLQFRLATGQGLRPVGFAPPGDVMVYGLLRGAPAPIEGRRVEQYESLWVWSDRTPGAVSPHGQPGVLTLALGSGPAADLAPWLAGAP
jgi:hypothetical protein